MYLHRLKTCFFSFFTLLRGFRDITLRYFLLSLFVFPCSLLAAYYTCIMFHPLVNFPLPSIVGDLWKTKNSNYHEVFKLWTRYSDVTSKHASSWTFVATKYGKNWSISCTHIVYLYMAYPCQNPSHVVVRIASNLDNAAYLMAEQNAASSQHSFPALLSVINVRQIAMSVTMKFTKC